MKRREFYKWNSRRFLSFWAVGRGFDGSAANSRRNRFPKQKVNFVGTAASRRRYRGIKDLFSRNIPPAYS